MALPQVHTKTILLGGGLDLESPMMSVGEGYALEAENFEPNLMGGYTRMMGIERMDGRDKPSDAIYHTIGVRDVTYFEVGEEITGSISGATAVVVAIDFNISRLGITNLKGAFVVGEAVGVTTTVTPSASSNHPDPDVDIHWELAAQNYYRELIGPVPGEGPVLGVWHWNGKSYAWRSDGAVVKMFESSSNGWQEISLNSLVKFNNGVLVDGGVVEGDTIVGSDSGATAIVKRFVKVSGSYEDDASGYAVVDVVAGTFTAGETINKGTTEVFSLDGEVTDISFFLGDNHFRFVNHNFYGRSDSYYIYGCDGVNRAFEWDGSVLTPIITGDSEDSPHHIEAHNNHLFLAFKGGRLQNSVVQQPLVFSGLLGSAEIPLGSEIRGIESVTGGALMISTYRNVQGLYGNNVDDWQLQTISIDSGDYGDTLAVIGSPIMVTSRGIQRIDPSDRFGNFESSTISRRINPLLRQWLDIKQLVGVAIVRDKNQYRMFFSDGTGFVLTADQLYGETALPAFTTFTLGVNTSSVCSVPTSDSREVILIGAESGYVYQLEKGFSLDGGEMQYALRLPFHHLGAPQVRKSFKWMDIESDVERSADLRITYEYSDGSSHTKESPITQYTIHGGSRSYWDESIWDEFSWSDEPISREVLSMTGTGHNISILFFGRSAVTSPFTIGAVTYQYLPRRLKRG